MNTKETLLEELISGGFLKTPRIIEAFGAIDRADFVLPVYQNEAYENYPLPIGESQTISQPLTVALMLELLDPQPGWHVLDIGSGSGWTTALLASIVSGEEKIGKVFAIERMPELCDLGKQHVAKYNFIKKRVAVFFCKDGKEGLPEHAPFQGILAGAAAHGTIPPAWRNQLAPGGRIVAPVGDTIVCLTKKTNAQWDEQTLEGFAFVPLR